MNKSVTIQFVFFSLVLLFVVNSCGVKEDSLKVYALDGGSFIFNNSLDWFTHGEEYDDVPIKTLANTLFLIEHPQGRLLWDAGLEDALADRNSDEIDSTAALVYFVNDKLIDQLKTMDLTPDSIKYLVTSHTHFDHVGNANYFKNSTWIIDEKEYNWAMGKEESTLYDSLRTSQSIQFEGEYDVFNDGKVIIYSTPGHTPGHMSLYVELKRNQSILLAGDLYHFNEQREYRRVPSFNTDSLETTVSMELFEILATQLNARVIIPHEVSHYLVLPKYPEYLE